MSNQPGPSVSATTLAAKPHELKLGQPTAFDGDQTKSRQWINNAQLYLLVNRAVYDHDDKKIAYMLSFMTEGPAGTWALTETETALKRTPQSFGSWSDFLARFTASFILENTKDQAIAWLSTAQVSPKLTLLEYVSMFKNSVASETRMP